MPRRCKWAEDLDAWEAALYRDGKSQATVRNYTVAAEYALRYAQDHGWPLNPRKLEPAHAYQYYGSIQGLRSKTQALYMHGFLAFLRFVKAKEMTDLNLRIRPQRGEVHWLTKEQVIALLERHPSPRILAARVLWAYTGIREFESRTLRKRNLTEKWLYVEAGKGRKARSIPIDDEFWAMMRPYQEWREIYERKWGATPYFLAHPENSLNQTGPLKPYTANVLSKLSREHGLSIGIAHATSHPFRRQFGRDLYDNGCPPTQIQQYYGHSTLEQTMDYIGKREEISWQAMRTYRSSYRRTDQRPRDP